MKRKIFLGLAFLLIFSACNLTGPCNDEEIKEYVREALIEDISLLLMSSDSETIRDYIENRITFIHPRLTDFIPGEQNSWSCSLRLMYDPLKDLWHRLTPEQRARIQEKKISAATETTLYYTIKKIPDGKLSIRLQNTEEIAEWILQVLLIHAMMEDMLEQEE